MERSLHGVAGLRYSKCQHGPPASASPLNLLNWRPQPAESESTVSQDRQVICMLIKFRESPLGVILAEITKNSVQTGLHNKGDVFALIIKNSAE